MEDTTSNHEPHAYEQMKAAERGRLRAETLRHLQFYTAQITDLYKTRGKTTI